MNSFLEDLARKIRGQLVYMSHRGKASHLGSSLSCLELVLAAYETFLRIDPKNPKDPCRDRFILSKGHAIATLYAILAERAFFPKYWLETFNMDGSLLSEHPTPFSVPGVEMATGSLGHGLSVGVGHALSARILKQTYRTLVLLSDGECNEGSVWEAALFATTRELDSLSIIIDFNKWQATGRTEDIMKLEPLAAKWKAFGWQTIEINGNDFLEILGAFEQIGQTKRTPTAIIAHTVKGKGISFMEDDNNWHYRIPNQEELKAAQFQLGTIPK